MYLFCANYHVHASFERLERKCKEHNSKENVQHDSSIKMISLIDNLFKAGTSFPFEIVVSGLLFSLVLLSAERTGVADHPKQL